MTRTKALLNEGSSGSQVRDGVVEQRLLLRGGGRGPHIVPLGFVIHVGVPRWRRRETTVALQVTAIMIGVSDLARSKSARAWGRHHRQDHPHFVSFNLGEGSSSLALYEREAAALDAGVSSEGSGFRGVSFHFIVASSDAVDEVMGNAVAAGGGVVRDAAASPWGYFGYFSDPDAYLWKVASGS
jgi:predicted enzyme related to lactoylglutathione lyase